MNNKLHFSRIQDRIWFVPSEEPKILGWSDVRLFGNELPICMEYCSGNGTWIVDKAAANPHSNWVAIEQQYGRALKIWNKVKKKQLTNLFVICGEGNFFTTQHVNNESVAEIFVNFPDPWPKRRHAKYRLINGSFAEQLIRILQLGGIATIVTDDPDYSTIIREVMDRYPVFRPEFSDSYANHIEGYGTSFFDQLWREKGREIRYHRYKKV